jgi:predicted dehydrogenase
MKPVNAAIFGLGWWGKKMTEVVNGRAKALRFTRAVEPNVAVVQAFADQHGLRLSSDAAAALDDPEIEAVILATPHSLHEAQIEQAVAAGKHVFCEKPLALTKAGALKAVQSTRAAGLVLGMGHERRWEPPIADLLAQAAGGRLGRILQIEANFSHDKFIALAADNWRLDASQAPAGGMTATGIHLTDLAVKLLGPARDVRVSCEQLASSIPQGDTMSAHVRFVGGGTAYISATLATPFVSRFAVYGSRGWIEVRDKAHVESPAGWVVTRAYTGTAIEVFEAPPAEPVRENLEAFARAVRGEAPYPISGDELVANIALLEAIVVGARSGELVRVP